ncbi:ParB/RepB/Spo0J family partition protein [Ruminococcus sp.]|uniref:ParB/RepB/Spo0J family partition protein n=1 Tax=Ruminococcus sp. TaxID=41978 RepID=UPI003F08B55F
MENKIVNIEIDRLLPHPQNPRKNLGDLSELADSIKKNGILQNLTVVKADEDKYTVIIGHRRCAAAKLAGLTELPCVVAEMDEAKQIETMLCENVQRSELTYVEQAEGFQLLLDMGFSVPDVAEKTGFSESTVRRRTSLISMGLDRDKLVKSQSRNISLEDYAKLQNIEDVKERNELLDSLGTNNFNNKYATAIERQKTKKELDEIEDVLKQFAEKSEEEPNYWLRNSEYSFVKRFYNKSEITDDYSEDEHYCYYRSDYSVALYKKKSQEERTAEEEKRMKSEERNAKLEEFRIKAKEISKRMYDLRIDFLQNYVGKSSDMEIMTKAILEYTVVEDGNYWNFDCFDLMTAIGIVIDEDNECLNFENIYERFPRRVLLAYTIAVIGDNDTLSHIDLYSTEKPYNPSVKLNRIYSLLCKLGYEMSDEEKQLRDGTHSIYMVNKDEEAEYD